MPQSMIGGGLASRCIFIYGDTKERYTAYVDEMVRDGDVAHRAKLIQDLERIAMLTGPFQIDAQARAWGKEWYEAFWKDAISRMDDQMMEGYAARKQTHMHKVAMVLSASRGDSLVITRDDLQLANTMLEDLESDMHHVFSRIGRTDNSLQAERFIDFVRRKGSIPYHDAYKMIHIYFPDFRDFEGILQGAINSGQIRIVNTAQGIMLQATALAGVAPITPDTKIV